MTTVKLAPGIELTTESSRSSYGQPILRIALEDTSLEFGPADIVHTETGPAYAADVVRLLSRENADITDDARQVIDAFVAVLDRMTATVKAPLHSRILAARRDAGFTQRELGERLGRRLGQGPVSKSTIAAWESGRSKPSPRYWKALRDLLGDF